MIDKALAIDSNNAFVYMIKGIGDYTRPSFAGGSKENGIINLKKAIEIYQQNPEDNLESILIISHYHLAEIFYRKKDYKQSIEYLGKTLGIASNYKRALELSKKIES